MIEVISNHLIKQKDIHAAYLFGSFDFEGSFSDIDLCILVYEKVPNLFLFEMDLESDIEGLMKYNGNARLLNNAPITFCQSVIRTGKIIHDIDPDLRAEFKNNILKKYFDSSIF
ncbi:MAG: hypothetical protein JW932_01205 [Deltaproteobacteria bacterium]|nr:hypothetical protein [Deltaproteobacteria bacterium]